MKTEIKTGVVLGIIILVGVTSLYLFYTEIDLKKNTTNQLDIQDKNLLKKSPNLKGMTGLIVDGDVKRASQKNKNLHDLKVKDIMTKKPLSVDKDMLAINALKLLNKKRITSLLVRSIKKNKIIGVLHIHKVLENIQ